MKYYIIAGEASGDLHGSNLVHEILQTDPEAVIRCWGGNKMQAAGAVLVKHYQELAFMGFWEVLKNISTIMRNLKFCKQDIEQFRPDALILIDYPGFNLRIARWAKQKGLTVIYYISPQVWAWKENRVKKMKLCIDKMLVILPFEYDYYKNKWNWEVKYVGHPLVEVIRKARIAARLQPDPEINGVPPVSSSSRLIALLPGSRKQEILKKLPVMLQVSRAFPDYRFVVAKAPGVEDSFYASLLHPFENVHAVTDKTYELLAQAHAALVTSGTATLETALFEVPEVVCYKGSWLSYQIGKRLVKVKFISLVNLILDQEAVPELIQHHCNAENLEKELRALLENESRRDEMKKHFLKLQQLLQQGGDASANAAQAIGQLLAGKK